MLRRPQPAICFVLINLECDEVCRRSCGDGEPCSRPRARRSNSALTHDAHADKTMRGTYSCPSIAFIAPLAGMAPTIASVVDALITTLRTETTIANAAPLNAAAPRLMRLPRGMLSAANKTQSACSG